MMKTFLTALVGALGMTAVALAGPDPTSKVQSASVAEVLADYGRLTGKKILCDPTVQGQLTFIAAAEENTDRKVELIEKTLFLYGFNLVDVGDDVIAVLGLGKPVRGVGLPVYTKPDELPGGQRVFSYVIKLEHREAQEMAATLTQYITPGVTNACTPDRGSNSLIVTGQTSVVRSVIKMAAMLDVAADPAGKAAEPIKPR